jgi:hypothetical protein
MLKHPFVKKIEETFEDSLKDQESETLFSLKTQSEVRSFLLTKFPFQKEQISQVLKSLSYKAETSSFWSQEKLYFEEILDLQRMLSSRNTNKEDV